MKKALLFGGGTFCIVLLGLGGLFSLAYFKGFGTAPEAAEVPGAAAYLPPTATSDAPEPLSTVPGTSLLPGTTPRPGATPTPRPVSFQLFIEQRQSPETNVLLNASVKVFLKAHLANKGSFEAHSAKVTARARVGREYVAIDGKQALVVPVGTVGANSTITKDLTFTMEMSLSQGRTAQSEGIYFEIVASSDEATSYMPLMRCTASGCAEA